MIVDSDVYTCGKVMVVGSALTVMCTLVEQ